MARVISRRKLAEYVADRLIVNDSSVLLQLAAYLIDTKKVSMLDLVVRDIESALMDRGVVIADVQSAHGLTEAVSREITTFLTTETKAKVVHLRETVDASLIGGIHVRTPAATFDTTIKHKLQQLTAAK